jgi:F-type H+-transporting ATPase subunit epsilon
MFLEIVTPDRKIYSGEIHLIQLPGSLGSFEILKNHAPIISTLERGSIKVIDSEGQETRIDVQGGVVEAADNKIIVLAETT